MRSSLRLGTIFGIPFGINYTWFIIFFIITVTLALHYFPTYHEGWSRATYWITGIVTSLLFFASVVAHELAHSLVSIRSGIPVKSITLFIFGGVARIAREATRPATELVMAAAGPLSSVALAAFFGLLAIWVRYEPLAALAAYLALINLLLAGFNLIPGFPLDGGRVLRSIIWWITGNYRKATRIASLVGQGVAYTFILGGILIMFRGYLVNGLWLAFIGWFLDAAASGSYRQAVLRDSLQGLTAGDVMTRDCLLVAGDLTLGALVQEHVLYGSHRCFFVSDEEKLRGIVTLHNIKGVPQQRWATTTVAQVMTPVEKLRIAHPSEDAASLLERMDEENINQLPVVEGGRVLGMVGRDNLLHFVRIRSELGM